MRRIMEVAASQRLNVNWFDTSCCTAHKGVYALFKNRFLLFV